MIKKTYSLDNTLRGSSNLHKLTNVYLDLYQELKLKTPLQKSDDTLITIKSPNWRGESYFWEIHNLKKEQLLVLEVYGGVNNYAYESDFKRFKINKETFGIDQLNITIHEPEKTTLSLLEKIISKYPTEKEE
jgi:hypothetical protein